MAASDIPATSEVLLETDGSKQILDAFLGKGWDAWGARAWRFAGCGTDAATFQRL